MISSMSASIIPKINVVKFCSDASSESVLIRRTNPKVSVSRDASSESVSVLVGRPSLMVNRIAKVKVKYCCYSPLRTDRPFPDRSEFDRIKAGFLERFMVSFDGKEEADLVQGKTMIGSSHGWLAFDNDDGLCLLNPLSGRSVKLPPLRGHGNKHPSPVKLILSHSPANDEQECLAFALGRTYNVAAIFKGKAWTPLDQGRRFIVHQDAVYSDARQAFLCCKLVEHGFFLLHQEEQVEVWDPSSAMKAPVATLEVPVTKLLPEWRSFLVAHEDEWHTAQLFLVRRYVLDDGHPDYEVFCIENYFGVDVLVPCESLDCVAIFIGLNHGFALNASKYPEYKPNCIYFSGDWNPYSRIDVYDYNKKSLISTIPTKSALPWITLTMD